MRKGIILDMDGTLVQVNSIRHHLVGRYRDFHRFHSESLGCPPNPEVIDAAVQAYHDGLAILIVTARVERYWAVTQLWLRQNLPIPWTQIYMRKDKDYRPDSIVKQEILCKIKADGFDPVEAWDDRTDVAAVWESHGIKVNLVEGFGFE
jgi:hypothetical protein